MVNFTGWLFHLMLSILSSYLNSAEDAQHQAKWLSCKINHQNFFGKVSKFKRYTLYNSVLNNKMENLQDRVKVWIASSHTLFARSGPFGIFLLFNLKNDLLIKYLPTVKRRSLWLMAILRSLIVVTTNRASKLLNIAVKVYGATKRLRWGIKTFSHFVVCFVFSLQLRYYWDYFNSSIIIYYSRFKEVFSCNLGAIPRTFQTTLVLNIT